MKKLNIQRVKAKVRRYRILKNYAKAQMTQGDVNLYVRDLINVYNTRSELKTTLVKVPVNR